MKSRVLSKVLLVFTLMITCVTSVFAKDNNKLLVNGKDFVYDILLKNGVSYMRADDFLDMFASEPPIKTNKSITYIKRCIPTQDSFFEIEYKDNSIAWNGKKTGAYAINSNGELYIPIKSVCKYLDYKTVWEATTGNVNLLTYHTESLKNKTVDVMGFTLPIRLFDDEVIRIEEDKLPYLDYTVFSEEGVEIINTHVDIFEIEKLQNLLTLMFNKDFSKQIIQAMHDTDSLIQVEVPLDNGLILTHFTTSDGLYSISVEKRETIK